MSLSRCYQSPLDGRTLGGRVLRVDQRGRSSPTSEPELATLNRERHCVPRLDGSELLHHSEEGIARTGPPSVRRRVSRYGSHPVPFTALHATVVNPRPGFAVVRDADRRRTAPEELLATRGALAGMEEVTMGALRARVAVAAGAAADPEGVLSAMNTLAADPRLDPG